MPITIEAVDPTEPVPRRVAITLTCDNHPELPAKLVQIGMNYMDVMHFARLGGWKITGGEDERRFLCPVCSGKPTQLTLAIPRRP